MRYKRKLKAEEGFLGILALMVIGIIILSATGCTSAKPHAYYVPSTGEVVIPYRRETITIPSSMVEDICRLRSQGE